MSWRKRQRDKTEAPIVRALRAVGASVSCLDGEEGLPDLLVGYQGRTVLMEVKTPRSATGKGVRGRISEGQEVWHGSWRGAPVFVVTSVPEALTVLGIDVDGGSFAAPTPPAPLTLPPPEEDRPGLAAARNALSLLTAKKPSQARRDGIRKLTPNVRRHGT